MNLIFEHFSTNCPRSLDITPADGIWKREDFKAKYDQQKKKSWSEKKKK